MKPVVRGIVGLDLVGDEAWYDLGYILKTDPARFASRLNEKRTSCTSSVQSTVVGFKSQDPFACKYKNPTQHNSRTV